MLRLSEPAREVVHSCLDRQVPPPAWLRSPCPPLTVKLKGSLGHWQYPKPPCDGAMRGKGGVVSSRPTLFLEEAEPQVPRRPWWVALPRIILINQAWAQLHPCPGLPSP